MPRDHDGERPKRSWRDIDKQKDGSQHRKPERPRGDPRSQARADSASKVYRGKLDAFFSGEGKPPAHVRDQLGKIGDSSPEGKKRAAALKKIDEAKTSKETGSAVTAFLARWELPPDYDVLAQVITSEDEEHVALAFDRMEELLDRGQGPRRTQVLEQRLRRVSTLADDPDLQERAAALIRRLRVFG